MLVALSAPPPAREFVTNIVRGATKVLLIIADLDMMKTLLKLIGNRLGVNDQFGHLHNLVEFYHGIIASRDQFGIL
jgi:hypothetical protein